MKFCLQIFHCSAELMIAERWTKYWANTAKYEGFDWVSKRQAYIYIYIYMMYDKYDILLNIWVIGSN